MCMGVPGRVVRLDGDDLADVDVCGTVRTINIGLLSEDPVLSGDWILIHTGFALSKMDAEEARQAMEFLVGIAEAYEREIAAPSGESVPLPGSSRA